MSLQNYWPSIENINNCIVTEAEELSEKLLLEVHEPMLLKKIPYGGKIVNADENDFFDFFIEPNQNRPIPVIGQNGTGKSHLVRWVDAKMKLLSNRNDYHVIRIPKSASLAKILHLILDHIEGEEFASEKEKIAGIGKTLIVRNVVQHLLLKLSQRLDAFFKENITDLDRAMQANNKQVSVLRQKKALDGVQILFKDPVVCQNFIKEESPFHNIAKRICDGASSDEIENGRFQLNAEDFLIQPNFNSTRDAQSFIRTKRLNNDQSVRMRIAALINQFIDDAYAETCAELCNIHRTDFSDIFENIRKHLLQRDKTLVVLIEDLSGLTGIQDELLTSLLLEGRSDGQQVLCDVKSIIAVTTGYEGYVSRRGMICSRAGYEWELACDEGNIENRIVSLCSRYINASRLGQKKLNTDTVYCDENLEDKDKVRLEAFGFSGKIPLFPFNKAAILKIAVRSQKLYGSDSYHFVPREIIKIVLEPVLKCGLEFFDKNNFPPSQFLGLNLETRFLQEFNQLSAGVDTTISDRLKSLVSVWVEDFGSVNDIKSELGLICESFDLPNIFASRQTEERLEVKPIEVKPIEVKPIEVKPIEVKPIEVKPKPIDDEPENLRNLLQQIDNWFDQNYRLSQNDARNLRNAIATGFNKWVCYDDYGFYTDCKITGKDISIPRADGQRRLANFLIVSAEDNVFNDDSLKNRYYNQVKAIIRFNFYNPDRGEKLGWEYRDGEWDYLHYANFFDSITPNTIKKIKEREFTKMTAIIQILLVSSRVLNIEGSYAKQKSPLLINALFAPCNYELDDDKWKNFKESCLENRDENIKKLKRLSCASKGKDKKTYAVNSQLILDSFKSVFLKDCKFNQEKSGILPRNFDRLFNPIINELDQLKNNLSECLGKEITRDEIGCFLERDVAQLKKRIERNGKTSIRPEIWDQFKKLYNYSAKNKEEISKAIISVLALDNQTPSEYLRIVASIPYDRLDKIRELLESFSLVFKQLDKYLQVQDFNNEAASITRLENSIEESFELILEDLRRLI